MTLDNKPNDEYTPEELNPDQYDLVEVVEDDDTPLDEGKRRFLLLLQLGLLGAIILVGFFLISYIFNPRPISEVLPVNVLGNNCYAPTYKFSIDGLEKPIGVAVSPDSQRIYIAEAGGERMIKMFDRDGNFAFQFAPIATTKSSRDPLYMATAPDGRLFAVDRYSNSINVYDADGNFIDAIIAANMTITKYLSTNGVASLEGLVLLRYDSANHKIYYQMGETAQEPMDVILDNVNQFTPMGVRFNETGDLLYTDASPGKHGFVIVDHTALVDLKTYAPEFKFAGKFGNAAGELAFPQTVVQDSAGNYYVADGNNSRISAFDTTMAYKTFFAFGSTEGALNLPRGMWVDPRDCLLVADALGANIMAYDLSSEEPSFAYKIGGLGSDIGNLYYPNDIVMDGTGRLYIADRANNRVQIWSY